MAYAKSLFVLCAILFMCGSAQAQASGCGSLAALAENKAPWLQTATADELKYANLLTLIDKSSDEFEKAAHATADANFILETGSAKFDQTYFEEHKREIVERIDQSLEKSHSNRSTMQYPVDLAHQIVECLKNENVITSCASLETDPNTVIFTFSFHPVGTMTGKFSEDILLSDGATYANMPKIALNGVALVPGRTDFQIDRSNVHNAFTLTFSNTVQSCFATAPPSQMQPPVLSGRDFNHSCVFDMSFNAETEGHVIKEVVCQNLPPGAKFVAVYNGQILPDEMHFDAPPYNYPQGFVRASLTAIGEDVKAIPEQEKTFGIHDEQQLYNRDLGGRFVLGVAGRVPGGDNGTDLKLQLTLVTCRSPDGTAAQKCSNKGGSMMTVVAIDP